MISFLITIFIYLIKTCFNLYFIIVLGRFLFQYFRIDFYNPISQLILKATNPILIPLQKFIPRHAKIDLASLLLLFTLKGLEYSGVTLLTKKIVPNMVGTLVWSFGEILRNTINIFIMAILMVSVLSWINLKNHTPFTAILTQLTEPLLHSIRKWLPSYARIDLSPLFVLIALQFANFLVEKFIIQFSYLLV